MNVTEQKAGEVIAIGRQILETDHKGGGGNGNGKGDQP